MTNYFVKIKKKIARYIIEKNVTINVVNLPDRSNISIDYHGSVEFISCKIYTSKETYNNPMLSVSYTHLSCRRT